MDDFFSIRSLLPDPAKSNFLGPSSCAPSPYKASRVGVPAARPFPPPKFQTEFSTSSHSGEGPCQQIFFAALSAVLSLWRKVGLWHKSSYHLLCFVCVCVCAACQRTWKTPTGIFPSWRATWMEGWAWVWETVCAREKASRSSLGKYRSRWMEKSLGWPRVPQLSHLRMWGLSPPFLRFWGIVFLGHLDINTLMRQWLFHRSSEKLWHWRCHHTSGPSCWWCGPSHCS